MTSQQHPTPVHNPSNNDEEDDNISEATPEVFRPKGMPPASAPPPPPATPRGNDDGSAMHSPYQQQEQATRAANIPIITYYDDDDNNNNNNNNMADNINNNRNNGTAGSGTYGYVSHLIASSFRGNVHLRPNTGLTNSYEDALFGLALHETLRQVRRVICTAAAVCLGLQILFAWRHVFFQWKQLVLAVYLEFFSLVLLLAELVVVLIPEIQQQQQHYRDGNAATTTTTTTSPTNNNNNMNGIPEEAATLSRIAVNTVKSTGLLERMARLVLQALQQHLGLVLHPLGKATWLILTATLCWAVGGTFEFLLGILFLLTGLIVIYLYATNPEYRNPPFTNLQLDIPDECFNLEPRSAGGAFSRQQQYAWANTSSRNNHQDSNSERSHLLGGYTTL